MDKVTYNIHRVINGPFECEKGDWWLTCSVECGVTIQIKGPVGHYTDP